jgi:hypothetical protein
MRLALGIRPLTGSTFRTLDHLVRAVGVHDLEHVDAIAAAGLLADLIDGPGSG